jgi:hypothetical protein
LQDTTQLNPRFGDKADLLALSAELHKRGMFLMVDIVVNHVVANPAPTVQEMIDLNPDLLWRKVEQYHPRCPMDYGNTTSVEVCWMGDDKLPLADVNTENVEVIQTLQTWIHDFVTEFGVDGLRIDGESPRAGRFEVAQLISWSRPSQPPSTSDPSIGNRSAHPRECSVSAKCMAATLREFSARSTTLRGEMAHEMFRSTAKRLRSSRSTIWIRC